MSAADFVRCAREQVGKPYKWATAGPDSYDCSGLVAACFERTQHEPMTRSSHQQFLLGEPVTSPLLQPGDLMFWDTMGDGAGHVAIYAGGDTVIHALNEERGVIESDADANMGGPFIGARRLFVHPGDGPPAKPPRAKREKRLKRVRREKRSP